MATTERDYYAVLGVPKTATQDEIKKAFRKLARQYHPDLHSGPRKAEMEKKFKELNEAHEVVGDPETRKKYDQYGHRWKDAEAYERARQQAGAGAGGWQYSTRQGGPEFTGEGFDFGDIFETMFNRGAGGARTGRGGFRDFAAQGDDLEADVRLTLREVLTGVTRRLQLAEQVPCAACGGSGRQKGRPCPICMGSGAQTETRTIEVKIPAGVQDGTRVRVAGKGHPGLNGGKPGDLYLRVHVESDEIFQRQGSDVHVTLPVSPSEAALGADVLAPTMTDPVRVKIPPGSRTGAKLRLKGKGLPTASGGRGDLFFNLQIVMPASLSEEERKLYEQLGRFSHPDPRADLLRRAGQR
jgi:DnaJ-class molecular chaperone